MKKILVTGASGYLAHRLLPIAGRFGEVIGVARRRESVLADVQSESLDITDRCAVDALVKKIQPDIILHTAASNPGVEESVMDAVNHLGSAYIATAAKTLGSRLVVVSTESVHNGLQAPYSDSAVADPVNTYGRTKALGEQAVMHDYPEAAIVRTSLIYGLEQMDRGTRGFVDRLERGEPLVLFDDVIRQPVWVDSLAEAICALAVTHTAISGLLNVVGSQALSRAEFARLMLSHWGVVAEGKISEKSGAGIAGLPLDLRSDCARARALGYALPGVSEVLDSVR